MTVTSDGHLEGEDLIFTRAAAFDNHPLKPDGTDAGYVAYSTAKLLNPGEVYEYELAKNIGTEEFPNWQRLGDVDPHTPHPLIFIHE